MKADACEPVKGGVRQRTTGCEPPSSFQIRRKYFLSSFGEFEERMRVPCPSGCAFVGGRSANRTSLDSPIRRGATPTLFPGLLGLHQSSGAGQDDTRAISLQI